MFPASFKAQLAQRMLVWGGMLGFLLLLFGATEIARNADTGKIVGDLEIATAMLAAHAAADDAIARIVAVPDAERHGDRIASELKSLGEAIGRVHTLAGGGELRQLADDAERQFALLRDSAMVQRALPAIMAVQAKLGNALSGQAEAVQGRLAALWSSDRRNKLLIALLAAFVLVQIVALERRWLVAPLTRLTRALGKGGRSLRDLAEDTMRRDEIGDLARAVESHVAAAERQHSASSEEQAQLTERLARQEEFRRESLAFQDRITEIVRQLEVFSGRMSEAARGLVSISSDADHRAGASAESTQRTANHIDVVAASAGEVSATLASAAAEAEGTTEVITAARELAQSANRDATELTNAARTIEQVIMLIQGVANQTNLLALNATIEAARAGDAGRGFAVVASEVKQLATRTSQATEEIREGLEGINLTSARIADRVTKLVESIAKVEGAAAIIATSMRRQDASSQTIATTTEQTARDVREIAETVQHVAALIADTRKAAETVTKVSAELDQQSGALRSAVDRFVTTTERVAA